MAQRAEPQAHEARDQSRAEEGGQGPSSAGWTPRKLPQDVPQEERDLTGLYGSVQINWPKTVGFYGGIALAISLELIEPELALFVAAIPIFKMLDRPRSARPWRFVTQLLDGAAQPVGGTGTGTIQLVTPDKPQGTNREE